MSAHSSDSERKFQEELLDLIRKLAYGGLEYDVKSLLEDLNEVIQKAHDKKITGLKPFDEPEFYELQAKFLNLRIPAVGQKSFGGQEFWRRLQKAGLESKFIPLYVNALGNNGPEHDQ